MFFWLNDDESFTQDQLGLNPCFNGLCSSGMKGNTVMFAVYMVSILVLMDYVLLDKIKSLKMQLNIVSILVLMDYVLLAHN